MPQNIRVRISTSNDTGIPVRAGPGKQQLKQDRNPPRKPQTVTVSREGTFSQFNAARMISTDGVDQQLAWAKTQYIGILNFAGKVTIETVASWCGLSVAFVYDAFIASANWGDIEAELAATSPLSPVRPGECNSVELEVPSGIKTASAAGAEPGGSVEIINNSLGVGAPRRLSRANERRSFTYEVGRRISVRKKWLAGSDSIEGPPESFSSRQASLQSPASIFNRESSLSILLDTHESLSNDDFSDSDGDDDGNSASDSGVPASPLKGPAGSLKKGGTGKKSSPFSTLSGALKWRSKARNTAEQKSEQRKERRGARRFSLVPGWLSSGSKSSSDSNLDNGRVIGRRSSSEPTGDDSHSDDTLCPHDDLSDGQSQSDSVTSEFSRGAESRQRRREQQEQKRLSGILDQMPGLTIEEFSPLVRRLLWDTNLQEQIQVLCRSEKSKFSKLLEPDQKMWRTVVEDSQSKITTTQHLVEDMYDGGINSIWDPVEESLDPARMDLPMSAYFIRASHNTYISTKQLMGSSHSHRYTEVLNDGCRCIEIDVYGKRIPVIRHGRSFSGELKLDDVLDKIMESAFSRSRYPLFISVEQHCHKRGQAHLATELQKRFPGQLANEPEKERVSMLRSRSMGSLQRTPRVFPSLAGFKDDAVAYHKSPNELMDTVLIKHKHGRKFDHSITSMTTNAKSISLKSKINRYLDHRKFEEAIIGSASEWKALSLMKNDATRRKWLAFNKAQICRTYPNASRTDSSNMDPQNMWNHGVQMCALNSQTPGRSMYLDHGMFTRNGSSGYVPKPEILRNRDSEFDPMKPATFHPGISSIMILSITVVGGRFIRSKKRENIGGLAYKPASDDGSDVLARANGSNAEHPVVQISINGVPADTSNDFVTAPSKSGGFACSWGEETFVKEILCPELATVGFVVKSGPDQASCPEDDVRICGQHFIPVDCMRQGYRSVQLLDMYNQPIVGSSILVRVVKTQQGTYYPFIRRQLFRMGIEGVLLLKRVVAKPGGKRPSIGKKGKQLTKLLTRLRIENTDDSFVLHLISNDDLTLAALRIAACDIDQIKWCLERGRAKAFTSKDANGVLFGLRLWFIMKDGHKHLEAKTGRSLFGVHLPCRSIAFAIIKVLLESNPEIKVDKSLDVHLMGARWFNAATSNTASVVTNDQSHKKATGVLKHHYRNSSIGTFQLPYILFSHKKPLSGKVDKLACYLQQVIKRELAGNIMGTDDNADIPSNGDVEEATTMVESFDFRKESRTFVIAGKVGAGKTTIAHMILVKWAQMKLMQQFSFVFLLPLSNLPHTNCKTLAALLHQMYFDKNIAVDAEAMQDVLQKEPGSVLLILDDVDLYWTKYPNGTSPFPFIDDLLRGDEGNAVTELPNRLLLVSEDRGDAEFRRQLYKDHSDKWYRIPEIIYARMESFFANACEALELDTIKSTSHAAAAMQLIIKHDSILHQFTTSPILLVMLSGIVNQRPEVFRGRTLPMGVTKLFQGILDTAVQKNFSWMTSDPKADELSLPAERRRSIGTPRGHYGTVGFRLGGKAQLKVLSQPLCLDDDDSDDDTSTCESVRIVRQTPLENDIELVPVEMWDVAEEYLLNLGVLAYDAFRSGNPYLVVTPTTTDVLDFGAKIGILEQQHHNVSRSTWRTMYTFRYKFVCKELECFFAAQHLSRKHAELLDPLMAQDTQDGNECLVLAEGKYHLLLRFTVGNLTSMFLAGHGACRKPLLQIISFVSENSEAEANSYIGGGMYKKVLGISPSIYALCLGCISECQMCGGTTDLLGDVIHAARNVLQERISLNGGVKTSRDNKLTQVDLGMISSCLPLITILQTNITSHQMQHLVELDVGGNSFGAAGMANLAQGLAGNSTLLKLNISDNEIEQRGTKMLVEVLSHETCAVHELRCHGNNIGDGGADLFAALLNIRQTLTYLGLMRNYISNKGAISIFAALERDAGCLAMLGLNSNRIGDRGVVMAAAMLSNNTILTKFALAKNLLTDRAVHSIAESLETNTTIKEILLMGNNLSPGVIIGTKDERLNLTKEYFTVTVVS